MSIPAHRHGATADLASDPVPGSTPNAAPGLQHPRQLFAGQITPIHTAEADPEGGAYGIWAAGEDYKVSFHQGMEFTPYLGKHYPRNQPFRWRTVSATIGEAKLIRQGPAPHQVDGTRFHYHLGGVIEAYDVRPEGLEQTFVIPERPDSLGAANPGALRIVGAVDTPLRTAPTGPRHQDLEFVDAENRPILSYGAAVAIDAQGRRQPMHTSFEEGRVVLQLDGEWLARAAYPVVVDPLLTNKALFTWNAGSGGVESTDCAFDNQATSYHMWYCYSRFASFGDADLWIRRTNRDVQNGGGLSVFSDLTSSWSTVQGSVATVYDASRGICAFVRDFGSTRSIRWHSHRTQDWTLSTSVGSVIASNNNWNPDVGGARESGDGTRAIIVWQHEGTGTSFSESANSEIHAIAVDVFDPIDDNQGTQVFYNVIGNTPNADHERPSISASSSAIITAQGFNFMHWVVAWQTWEPLVNAFTWDVEIAALDYGAGVVAQQLMDRQSFTQQLSPKVAGAGGRFLVQCVTAPWNNVGGKTTSTTGYALSNYRMDLQEPSSLSFAFDLPHGRIDSTTSPFRLVEAGALAYRSWIGNHWISLHKFGSQVRVETLGYRGGQVDVEVAFTGSSAAPADPGGITYNFPWDAPTFTFSHGDRPTGIPVYGNIYRFAYPPLGTYGGVSCSPFGLAFSGEARIGNEGVRFLSLAPTGGYPAGPHLLAVSLSTVDQPIGFLGGIGMGCRLLVNPDDLSYFSLTFGSRIGNDYQWEFDLPEGLPAVTLHAQDFHLDAARKDFLSTRRLSMPFVR